MPRNDRLDALDPRSSERSVNWARYLHEWVRMNHVRTITPLVTAVVLPLSRVYR